MAADNPVTAQRVIERILQAVAVLVDFPLLGRPAGWTATANSRSRAYRSLPFITSRTRPNW
jgi:plasmid stabilization system protein ParE